MAPAGSREPGWLAGSTFLRDPTPSVDAAE